jgi:hypothetical protein
MAQQVRCHDRLVHRCRAAPGFTQLSSCRAHCARAGRALEVTTETETLNAELHRQKEFAASRGELRDHPATRLTNAVGNYTVSLLITFGAMDRLRGRLRFRVFQALH